MSNIFKSENLDIDFDNFQLALLKTNEFKFEIDEKIKPLLKKYHRFTYALALIHNKLEDNCQDENKFLFVNEILSDLLANTSLCFLGFYNSSQIIFRRLLENFYNHVYYFEHPVEFELLNLGRNDYTPIIELKTYYENHPIIKGLVDKNIKIFNDQIFQHYQELCRTVHTKGESFMGLAKNLEEIKLDFDLHSNIDQSNKSIQSIIYLLFKFHRDLTFSNVERDLIAKSFPKNLRRNLLD